MSKFRLLNVSVLGAMLVAVLCAPRPSGVEAHATTAPANALTSGAQINAYLTSAHLSGYVLLERYGRVILSKGYGWQKGNAYDRESRGQAGRCG